MKLNRRLFPIKAHFFLFMAASGPILPYLTVYGKDLGISEVVMGTITSLVPLTFLLAKPVFGFIADYFYDKRKIIFMALIMTMSLFYLALYFIPPVNISVSNSKLPNLQFSLNFSYCHNKSAATRRDPKDSLYCNASCNGPGRDCQLSGKWSNENFCYEISENACNLSEISAKCHKDCVLQLEPETSQIYKSLQFYGFVLAMTFSTISFNVGNSISDAICFDILGEEEESKYGYQRVWGTIGFGITAFLGGAGMDLWSNEGQAKDYNPAFIMVIVLTAMDLMCCSKLKLPRIEMSTNILKELSKVFKNKRISIFLVFATLVGVLDGFLIYFMFWFVEDLAAETNETRHIKVLEGLTVAAETLGGEILFFLLSGKIIKKLGYENTLSLCFLNYAIRLYLISAIRQPWWIVAVELFMQGPTYALCYTTIVAYANAVAPPGGSATMQGIVAGMDDGIGYSIGSLLGGFLYKSLGGRSTFRLFSGLAILCCLVHTFLHKMFLQKPPPQSLRKEYEPPPQEVDL